MSLFQAIILVLAIWIGWKIYQKLNKKVGDDPKDLTLEEKYNAAVNKNEDLEK